LYLFTNYFCFLFGDLF
jgi:hypothetical protein